MKNYLHVIYLVLIMLLVGYLNYLIFAPFLVAIFLAFIFSHLFRSLYEKINIKLGGRKSLASFLSCLLIFLLLIIPIGLITTFVVAEINQTYQNLQQKNLTPVIEKITNQPLFSSLGLGQLNLGDQNDQNQIAGAVSSIGNFTFQIIKKTYQSASHFAFMTVVLFFTLYYFFKDGEFIQKKIMEVSPLRNNEETFIINKFISVTKATLKGSLVIALIQGILLGTLFAVTGVSSPVFWGVITVFFSLIPMLGAAIVWVPVAIIMLMLGNVWQGIVIAVIGGLVVSSIDNILRPMLVGNQASLHPLLVFFSTLGGIAVFGLTGFLLGPIIVVLFVTLLNMYRNEFKRNFSNTSA